MKLICGLGNPGSKYTQTRHNIGFRIADRFLTAHGLSRGTKQYQGEYASGVVAGIHAGVLKPATYMNLSGESVREAATMLKCAGEDILIVHDDADLCMGQIRFKKGGGDGGHNGLKSIIEELGHADFGRLRIGVGRNEKPGGLIHHVLSPFAPDEDADVEKILAVSVEAIDRWLKEGYLAAMNAYNRKNAL